MNKEIIIQGCTIFLFNLENIMVDWINWFKLKQKLLSLSNSQDWSFAKNEWILDNIYYLEAWEDFETCSCSHYPIQEVCVIINSENNNKAIVWNVCIKKFIDQIDSWNLFDWLKKISNDLWLWPSKELIEYAFKKKYINDWEHKFCINRFWKKKFSWKQLETRKKINQKILEKVLKKDAMET